MKLPLSNSFFYRQGPLDGIDYFRPDDDVANALSSVEITALSADQAGALTGGQIAALTATNFAAPSTSSVASLSVTALVGMTSTDIGPLTTTQGHAFTSTQRSHMSVTQVNALINLIGWKRNQAGEITASCKCLPGLRREDEPHLTDAGLSGVLLRSLPGFAVIGIACMIIAGT
jgi:hypothetical protein